MKNIKKEVKSYLEKQGFSCVVRPNKEFTDILAYISMGVDVEGMINSKVITKKKDFETQIPFKIDPFILFEIKCKEGKLTKLERKKAEELINKKGCNAFLVAFKKGKKLLFNQYFLKSKKQIPILNDNYTRYIA